MSKPKNSLNLSGASNFASPLEALAAAEYTLNEFEVELKKAYISDIEIGPVLGNAIIYFLIY
jgi:hypothetical protein